jgi:hypothetical protein
LEIAEQFDTVFAEHLQVPGIAQLRRDDKQ